MDRFTTKVSLGLIFVLCTALSFWYIVRRISDDFVHIGILYTPKQAYHCTVTNELKKLVAESSQSICIREFAPTTNADPMLVQAAANAALDDKRLSLIVSIGAVCSQTLVGISKRRKSKKPIIFIGADAPVKLGLVKSLDQPKGCVTGVIAKSTNILNSRELLCIAKPQTKKVILPYYTQDATDMIEHHVEIASEYCRSHGVKVKKLPIDNMQNALSIIMHNLADSDALIYFEGDLLCSLAASLAKICSTHNKTLLAGSIDVADKSALCYAVHPRYEPQEAFKIIKKILFKGVLPRDIPVSQPQDCRDFVINTTVCKEQDIKDVDSAAIIKKIRSNPQLALIHEHIVVV